MKIFIDTNVLLDYVLQREGFKEAGFVFQFVRSNPEKHRLYASYLTMANVAYILRKTYSQETVRSLISSFRTKFDVLGDSDYELSEALKIQSPDLEDSMQIACAELKGCDCILTGNAKHFKGFTSIPVLSTKEFVSLSTSN